MDYASTISNNECFKAYFTRFPKDLMQVAKEGKVFRFKNHGLLINFQDLFNYLLSDECIFEMRTPIDFYESLHVLQFCRSVHAKEKLSYLFINPNFQEGCEVPDDFYKTAIDVLSCNLLKGTKRMSKNHYIGIFDRLLQKHERSNMSPLEVSRLQAKFTLQRKIDLEIIEECIIEHELEEPEYAKNNEIAGYYGLVSLSALKQGFHNYFPMYQENESNQIETVEKTEENADEQEAAEKTQSASEIEQVIGDLPKVPSQTKRTEVSCDENKENEPPNKKHRRFHKTKKQKITQREINDAVMSLEMEIDAIDKVN